MDPLHARDDEVVERVGNDGTHPAAKFVWSTRHYEGRDERHHLEMEVERHEARDDVLNPARDVQVMERQYRPSLKDLELHGGDDDVVVVVVVLGGVIGPSGPRAAEGFDRLPRQASDGVVQDEVAEGSSHLLSSFMCIRNGGVVGSAFTSIFDFHKERSAEVTSPMLFPLGSRLHC